MLSATDKVWGMLLGNTLPGASLCEAAGKPVRMCSRVIKDADLYIRKVEMRGGHVGRAKQLLKSAKRLADRGEEIQALLAASQAVLAAKSAVPRRGHQGLHNEGHGLLGAANLAMDAYQKANTK